MHVIFFTNCQRFVSVRDAPKVPYSDKGNQLVLAGKEFEGIGRNEGITWIFTKSYFILPN